VKAFLGIIERAAKGTGRDVTANCGACDSLMWLSVLYSVLLTYLRACLPKANSQHHAIHDTDRTVLSCLVWRCELSRLDRQTGAFCVWSVSECVMRVQCDRRTHSDAEHTCPAVSSHRHTRQDRSACLSTAAAATQARQAAAPSRPTAHTRRRCTPRRM